MSSTNSPPRWAPLHPLSHRRRSRRRTAHPHPALALAATPRHAEVACRRAHRRPAGFLAPPLFHRGGIGRLLGRPAQQARAPCPLGRTPSHRPRAPRGRPRRSGRARTHPPLPRWHDSHGVLAGGLDGTTGRPRAPTARASHPVPFLRLGGSSRPTVDCGRGSFLHPEAPPLESAIRARWRPGQTHPHSTTTACRSRQ